MQPRRRGAVAVVAVVMLGLAAIALVVLASAGGSVRPVSESTLSSSPRPLPTKTQSAQVTVPTPGAPPPAAHPPKPVKIPDWVKALWQALFYTAAILVVLLLGRVLYRLLRKVELPEAENEDSDWERMKVDRLAEAVESGLAAVDSGTATDAVIACWVALEDAAASAGVERAASETPAEFTVRVLGVGGISEPELLRLGQLYREARYSTHGSSEEARSQAREALIRLRDELAAAMASRAARAKARAEAEEAEIAAAR
ncbi:DUF4129 domain-containing protein [Kribbella qitaiheensis]|uniref:DUF4129 domain-containing protein n=1 Tax=Kribbella qitaiheensis TaxID=1544730 RepID=A0A7G6X3T7_9ACTN|nr:DUF4129 domain-containing protein [Kribbella qitaiheensis]QNE20902.1 DUF4129 domain-containing protein [Kribbella qitaiheensis]